MKKKEGGGEKKRKGKKRKEKKRKVDLQIKGNGDTKCTEGQARSCWHRPSILAALGLCCVPVNLAFMSLLFYLF